MARASLTSHEKNGEAVEAGLAVPLAERDPEHLFRIIVLNPAPGHGRGGHVRLISPLHNLYFMRDQQAATDKGICMGRMATHERSGEVAVSTLGLKALGVEPVHGVIRDGSRGETSSLPVSSPWSAAGRGRTRKGSGISFQGGWASTRSRLSMSRIIPSSAGATTW